MQAHEAVPVRTPLAQDQPAGASLAVGLAESLTAPDVSRFLTDTPG